METAQGYEYQLGVNHLGHFLWTTMLLPLLKENPKWAAAAAAFKQC
jgi:NAD(P)-dependent dehydrogenase (short-subunit alcohol dehydrogenase family)